MIKKKGQFSWQMSRQHDDVIISSQDKHHQVSKMYLCGVGFISKHFVHYSTIDYTHSTIWRQERAPHTAPKHYHTGNINHMMTRPF